MGRQISNIPQTEGSYRIQIIPKPNLCLSGINSANTPQLIRKVNAQYFTPSVLTLLNKHRSRPKSCCNFYNNASPNPNKPSNIPIAWQRVWLWLSKKCTPPYSGG
ncbi:hypothetical protein EJK55_0571 [Moraxella catarrhalis]|nr:hypothetical protein EJK55_0571 [Moraxella catarrhalis]